MTDGPHAGGGGGGDEEAADGAVVPRKRNSSAKAAESSIGRTSCYAALVLVAFALLGAVCWLRYRDVVHPAQRVADEAPVPNARRIETGKLSVSAVELTDKPSSDARTYASATLRNGLQVLAVQDTRSRSSAFSVAVSVGSYDDPWELPGLSHFCEHMLFLGTERFPDPQGFDMFVARSGGEMNAYTSSEVTVYYVQLSEVAAPEGLERFADFFRAPLFNSTYVQKEVHAIDSEHAKNVEDPGRRVYAVMQSLANPASVLGRFATGNIDTLYRLPKEKGIDPMQALRHHFAKNYCPARMRLVTFGSEPVLDQLAAAERTFGPIPSGGVGGGADQCASEAPTHRKPEAWPASSLGKWVDVEGMDPHSSIQLAFSFPDLRDKYAAQPFDYMVWAMGYQGERSLYHVLRDGLGLAHSVSSSADASSAGTTMWLNLGLTEAGRARPDLVLDVVFGYFASLRRRGVDEVLLQSIEEAAQLGWTWAEPMLPTATVQTLSERMTRLPTQDLLWGDSVARKLDPKLVADLMELLKPTNANVVFVDPRPLAKQAARGVVPGVPTVQELPYYGVRYAARWLEDVFPGARSRWVAWADAAKKQGSDAEVEDDLRRRLTEGAILLPDVVLPRLPLPISGLPKPADITLGHAFTKVDSAALVGGAVKRRVGLDERLYGPQPEALHATGLADALTAFHPDIWYREGWKSNAPKASPQASLTVALRVRRPAGGPEESPAQEARMLAYGRLLGEEMNVPLADVSAKGATWSVLPSSSSLMFGFGGFETLMKGAVPKVTAEFKARSGLPSAASRFARVRERLVEELQDYSDMPITYAIADRTLLLTKGANSREDLLREVQKLSVETAAASLKEVLLEHPLELTALAMGNIDKSEALAALGTIAAAVPQVTAASGEGGVVERVTPVVALQRPVEVRKRNPRRGDPNDAVVVSLVAGLGTVESRVVIGLLGQMLGRLAYSELRTSMQLGYVVNAGQVTVSNVLMMSVVVQGNVLKADDVEAAIQRVYTVVMPKFLAQLSDQEFNSYKGSFVDGMLQDPFHTADEVAHFWPPVLLGGDCYGLQEELLQYLNSSAVTKELLVSEWQKLVLPAQGVRPKLVVKYFADKADPPARPDVEQAAKAWEKQGISGPALDLLRREHAETLVLDSADAAARAKVLEREGGKYFPPDIFCKASSPQTGTPAVRQQRRYGAGGVLAPEE